MSTLTIRNIDPTIKERLRLQAVRNGRSMQGELRHILDAVVGMTGEDREADLAEAIRRRFAPFGGVDDLEVHPSFLVGKPQAFGR